MITLNVKKVNHWFGSNKVLFDVNVDVAGGQVVALVGPSGCGKSTLLRGILGTHPPCAGEIWTLDKRIIAPSRNVGIVYQGYDLYDFMTARQNVAFGLMLDQTSIPYRCFRKLSWRNLQKGHLEKADELLEKVGLAEKGHLYPKELSGGQQQRVAICQAIIMEPEILLLDEPFGALDEATREELQTMILKLYQENLLSQNKGSSPKHTILIVTHELNEALYVSDRVIGLSQYHVGNMKDDGKFENKVGATIVYDKAAPVFLPEDARDFGRLLVQREELRKVVFNEEDCNKHQEHVTFWGDYKQIHETPGYSKNRIDPCKVSL